jgi:hypothetical protein
MTCGINQENQFLRSQNATIKVFIKKDLPAILLVRLFCGGVAGLPALSVDY